MPAAAIQLLFLAQAAAPPQTMDGQTVLAIIAAAVTATVTAFLGHLNGRRSAARAEEARAAPAAAAGDTAAHGGPCVLRAECAVHHNAFSHRLGALEQRFDAAMASWRAEVAEIRTSMNKQHGEIMRALGRLEGESQ